MVKYPSLQQPRRCTIRRKCVGHRYCRQRRHPVGSNANAVWLMRVASFRCALVELRDLFGIVCVDDCVPRFVVAGCHEHIPLGSGDDLHLGAVQVGGSSESNTSFMRAMRVSVKQIHGTGKNRQQHVEVMATT